ncbi:hypothetical protein QN277_026383 [Acacia crassicarpa]|uniref:GH18 domain-containing protein n=1 Tax=Acacia crassicarpa TaxID=499986 RepID=A0AAE1MLW3_9FABA|nr:hypothetical protein QN277_026383 [Acacia crassicarpa]
MMSRTAIVLFLVSLYLPIQYAAAEKLKVRAGSWMSDGNFFSEINSKLFTHLLYAEAYVNTSPFEVEIFPSDEPEFVTFSKKVKEKNPSVKTLLSIWGEAEYALMMRNPSSISSFIRSAQNISRRHGFDGVDLYWDYPKTKADKEHMESLFQEWRKYIHANDSELILTATVPYSPDWPHHDKHVSFYPIRSMARYLDWVHLVPFHYLFDQRINVSAAHSAFYDPTSYCSTAYGISNWIRGGLMPSKIVMGLPFSGYAWNLPDPKNNNLGVQTGKVQIYRALGMMTYKEIRGIIPLCGGKTRYSDTHKIYHFSCGSTWIGFDDVKTIKIKVSYAKEHKLLGYVAWRVSYDDNGLLSRAGRFS